MTRNLVAILRGLHPERAVETATVIAEAGIGWIDNRPMGVRGCCAMARASHQTGRTSAV